MRQGDNRATDVFRCIKCYHGHYCIASRLDLPIQYYVCLSCYYAHQIN
jgi:hypothetical protein